MNRKMLKEGWPSKGRFSQIWLQTKDEVKFKNPPVIFMATHLKPNVKIWQFIPFLIFNSLISGDWNLPKSLHLKKNDACYYSVVDEPQVS